MNGVGDICEFNKDEDVEQKSVRQSFMGTHTLVCEKAVIKGTDNYILHIATTQDNNPTLAVGASDGSVQILEVGENDIAVVRKLESENGQTIGLVHSSGSANCFYVGRSNSIELKDLRTKDASGITLKDNTSTEGGGDRTFATFDVSSNERLVSAGTELYRADSYLLFWDLRNHSQMGGYWESHTDDITTIKCHPRDPNKLISGSTDGLINIFDLTQSSEEDALIDSLNTNSSVEQIAWLDSQKSDVIFCATHTHDIQLWKPDEAEPFYHLKRSEIAKNMKRTCLSHSYVVGAHNMFGNPYIITGSNWNDGECLRSFKMVKKTLVPIYNFIENKQRVRCSAYCRTNNFLITSGEKGLVDVWKLDKC